MSSIAPRRIALVAVATAGLLLLAVMLFGGAHDSVGRPGGHLWSWVSSPPAVRPTPPGPHAAVSVTHGSPWQSDWAAGQPVRACGATSLWAASHRSRLPRPQRSATWCCRYVLWAQRFWFPIVMTTCSVSACCSTGFSLPRRCSLVVGAADRVSNPADHFGRHHGYLSRARRHCINCRADNRARPQALNGAAGRGLRRHRYSRSVKPLRKWGRPHSQTTS